MDNFEEIITREGVDKFVEILFHKGYSQIDTVKLIIIHSELKLKEADRIVLNHKVWSKLKKGNVKLRNLFLE